MRVTGIGKKTTGLYFARWEALTRTEVCHELTVPASEGVEDWMPIPYSEVQGIAPFIAAHTSPLSPLVLSRFT